ncbi:hypothetical protein [Spirochaeta dissipatitropha]
MIQLFQISESEIETTIQDHEYPESVRSRLMNTAVIATQDWCPDWSSMQRWLHESEKKDGNVPDVDIAVGIVIYNKKPYQNEFMRVKERSWKNALIPYIRYYHNGQLISESNRVSRKDFITRFSATHQ